MSMANERVFQARSELYLMDSGQLPITDLIMLDLLASNNLDPDVATVTSCKALFNRKDQYLRQMMDRLRRSGLAEVSNIAGSRLLIYSATDKGRSLIDAVRACIFMTNDEFPGLSEIQNAFTSLDRLYPVAYMRVTHLVILKSISEKNLRMAEIQHLLKERAAAVIYNRIQALAENGLIVQFDDRSWAITTHGRKLLKALKVL